MEAPPLRIGRYELLERLGHGSLGALYRGRDTLLGREVAVKVMSPGLLGDTAAHARFFREAKAAARLQHVNIVTIFEFGEHDETPYIVMEFLHGCSLADRMRREPTMPLREKLDAAIQLCSGLEAAHAQGVVHRDVKPGNVWICQDGTVKLLDFGIATAASSSATFDVLGSPGYISPEQVAGKDVDGRTDIFSSGVVLYEMLAGRRPFDADSPTGVMLKIVNENPDPLVDPELPPTLTAAVGRAMEKSPAARYSRAADLARELKSIKSNLPLPLDPPTMQIERTMLHIPQQHQTHQPPVPVVAEAADIPPRTFLDTLRDVGIGRQHLVLGIVLLVLAIAVLVWYFWPTGQATVGATGATPSPVSAGAALPSPPPAATTPAPAPPPPAPPAVTPVALRFTSRPPAAKILLDGRDSGKTTPAEISVDPSRAPQHVQFELSGFKPEEVSVTPDVLRSGAVTVALSPRDPAVRVTLVASGDYKFDVADRQKVLSANNERHDVVVSGLRSVQLRADRYFLDQTVRVDRAEGGTVKAAASPLGSVTVYASGVLEDCKVFIDGRIVDSGSLPVVNREIASGSHSVKLSCSRGETDAQAIAIQPHQNMSIRFPASTPVRPR